MKYLKHIKEMDEWATPNRISGDYGYYTEITPDSVRLSLKQGPPMRVRIKKTSRYYGISESNPKDIIGTIIERPNGQEGGIRVEWDNGCTNGYRCEDLEIA